MATKYMRDAYLDRGRATAIPEGERGLWSIKRHEYPPHLAKAIEYNGWPCFTVLGRWTDSTIHLKQPETVMSDNGGELKKHLSAAMTARGKVLVTGLGLACVARMLQCNDKVECVTIVEKSQEVIDLVWPHTSHDRIELIHADAFDFLLKTNRTWDCAWHDIWTDPGRGEPKLAVAHQWLMFLCCGRAPKQGAWAFPRDMKRISDLVMERRSPGTVRRATARLLRKRLKEYQSA